MQFKKVKKIFEAKYEQANLKEITTKFKYFNSDEQAITYRLLTNHENMFDGTLSNCTTTKKNIELLEGTQPFYAKPFPIPKVYEENLKTEVNRLVNIGVLKR